MKVPCEVHGAHFRQEFVQTLKRDCPVWEMWGLAKLERDLKLVYWQWLFKAPFDEIWLKTGFQIGIVTVAKRSRVKAFWQKHIQGYARMSEAERQAAQKIYLLNKSSINKEQG